jgi:ppGpp synthetase/RelA/SpoT-type nucleotidyltranferase
VEKKDQDGRFYRATHCQVALKAEDLVEPFDNLEGITCEIQVCSLLAHVWNELEHDLVYKPTTGTFSGRESDSLAMPRIPHGRHWLSLSSCHATGTK